MDGPEGGWASNDYLVVLLRSCKACIHTSNRPNSSFFKKRIRHPLNIQSPLEWPFCELQLCEVNRPDKPDNERVLLFLVRGSDMQMQYQ